MDFERIFLEIQISFLWTFRWHHFQNFAQVFWFFAFLFSEGNALLQSVHDAKQSNLDANLSWHDHALLFHVYQQQLKSKIEAEFVSLTTSPCIPT